MASDVFSVISLILIANLCFTLQRTFSENNPRNPNSNNEAERIQGLLSVPIQALIIGLITILPRYSDYKLLEILNGINGYLAVVVVSVAALVPLYMLWQKETVKNKQKPETETTEQKVDSKV